MGSMEASTAPENGTAAAAAAAASTACNGRRRRRRRRLERRRGREEAEVLRRVRVVGVASAAGGGHARDVPVARPEAPSRQGHRAPEVLHLLLPRRLRVLRPLHRVQ
ncbi:hypothetical protein EE612_040790 [Oryza sativa]|nr:hypothetical protein EE612_040790 [Oryza sativa]